MRNQRFGNCARRLTSWLVALAVMGLGADCGNAAERPSKLDETAQMSSPLLFERNVGQAGPNVAYLAHAGRSTLYFDKNSVSFLNPGVTGALRLSFSDSSYGAAKVDGLQQENVPVNYLVGSDPGKWRTRVPVYERVRYRDVHPGLDVIFYGRNGRLEFDLITQAGADPSAFAVRFDGGPSRPALALDESGDLVVRHGSAEYTFRRPELYQSISGERHKIEGGFRVDSDGNVRFWTGSYRHDAALVIDPVLTARGFFGQGAAIYNGVTGIATDPAGNIYVSGTATNQASTKNAFQPDLRGEADAFLAKYDCTGKKLLYATYFGGSDSDGVNAIAVDWRGFLHFAGGTNSQDLPLQNAFQATPNGGGPTHSGAYVAVLDDSGTRLVLSSYFGGTVNGVDPAGHTDVEGMAVDEDGGMFVVGKTDDIDFPVTASALEGTCPRICSDEGFFAKVDVFGGKLTYASYIGGSGDRDYPTYPDSVSKVATYHDGSVFVAGQTVSTDFPLRNPLYSTLPPKRSPEWAQAPAAFLMKFDKGMNLIFSTLFGPTGSQDILGSASASGLAVDAAGNPYIYGQTSGSTLPLKNAYRTTPTSTFAAKFRADGSALTYSTYLFQRDSVLGDPNDLAVDPSGRATIGGFVEGTDPEPPLVHPIESTCALVPEQNGCGYLAQLSRSGSQLAFSSFFNGPNGGPAPSEYYQFTITDTVTTDILGDILLGGRGWGYPIGTINPPPNLPPTPYNYFSRLDASPVDAATNLRAFVRGFGEASQPARDMWIVEEELRHGKPLGDVLHGLDRFDMDVSGFVKDGRWATHTGAEMHLASQQLRARIASE